MNEINLNADKRLVYRIDVRTIVGPFDDLTITLEKIGESVLRVWFSPYDRFSLHTKNGEININAANFKAINGYYEFGILISSEHVIIGKCRNLSFVEVEGDSSFEEIKEEFFETEIMTFDRSVIERIIFDYEKEKDEDEWI